MAGEIRQPIDIASLERYVTSNVPEIKTPITVKQVHMEMHIASDQDSANWTLSLAMDNQTPHIN